MATNKETYLGNVFSADGRIFENIAERYKKGIRLVNQILSILKEVHFGRYFFEMAIVLQNAILLNGMLLSIKALYGLKVSALKD